MPLNLITGPVNSGKAAIVLDAVAAAAANGADPILVVPTLADSDLLRRELAAPPHKVTEAVTVIGFSGLWGLIARRVEYEARPLPPFSLARIARVVSHETPLSLLADSAASGGFAAALAKLADELGEVRATPQRFEQIMQAWDQSSYGMAPYGAELAALYSAYRARLEKVRGRDQSGYVCELIDCLEAKPQRWKSTPVFFYGFDDFELRQLDTIKLLSGTVASELMISFPYEERTAFDGRRTIFDQLNELAGESVTQCAASTAHYAPESAEALAPLERSLFEIKAEAFDPGQAIERFQAGGERAEIELIAARARALIEQGLPAEQIAVAVRDLDQSAFKIEKIFAEAEVPVAIRKRISIGQTPLVRGILALVECALCEQPDKPVSQQLIGQLIVWLRALGVTPREFHLKVDSLERDYFQGKLPTLEAAEQEWLRLNPTFGSNIPLDSLRKAFESGPREGYRSIAARARRVLAEASGAGAAPIFDPEQQASATALGDLILACDDLDWLVGKDPDLAPSGSELLRELKERQIYIGESLIPGAVSVALPLALRARRVKALFVARLQEGLFPQRAPEDPFLDDAARRNINRAASDAGLGALWPGGAPDRIAAERHLLHALLSRASQLLIYSHHARTDNGAVANPSLFLDDIEDLFEPKPLTLKRALGEIDWPSAAEQPRLAPSDYQRRLGELTPLASADQSYQLSSEAAIAALAGRGVWSATSIERYLRCRMAWLIDNFLRPEQLEPRADQLAYGSAVHAVLQAVFEQRANPGKPFDEASLGPALKLVDSVIAGLDPFFADPIKEQIQLRALRRAVASYLTELSTSGSDFVPSEFELRFGFGEEPSADLGDGLLLRGKIDRVDRLGSEAIIVDYKSGAVHKHWPQAKWVTEGVIQNALYALVYANRNPDQSVVGALYQSVSVGKPGANRPRGAIAQQADAERTDIVGTDRIAEEDLTALLEAARELAAEAVAGICRGELTPQDPKHCSYGRDGGCAYPGICRRTC